MNVNNHEIYGVALGVYSPNIAFIERWIKKIISFFCPMYKENIIPKFPCSGYAFYLEGKIIVTDMGAGTLKYLEEFLYKTNKTLKDVTLIITHNHFDHILDTVLLLYKSWFRNIARKDKIKVEVYLPKKSIMYWFIKFFPTFIEHVITNNVKIDFGNYQINFCKTDHKGESYAVKISRNGKNFVYTSDIFSITPDLTTFCKNSDYILTDSGHPCVGDEPITLPGYHGEFSKIIEKLFDLGTKKIYAAHLKRKIPISKYITAVTPEKAEKIHFMKQGEKFDIFIN